ncbi:uncharacterized protein PV07_09074 [Cladophialophora immunda]|uniref:Cytochrome P450 n=1 Tax=Cladophialophora immunda TaxID=569365 RepID=A0A0D2C633_9EURO|nr:uncharacterized protein PV07_09074 [Cladophialophora immunda]KIW25940.1 hypothetical protein PV07_09074 [Cladophialophora immunda]OQU98125.1 hypothetical protein CLAIMM_03950 [Cladophialophora immunda]
MAYSDLLLYGLGQALAATPVVICGAVFLYLLYLLSLGIYNIYFHPLSKFPGPKLACATELFAVFHFVRGQRVKFSKKLHAQYGEVVRTRPNELSFLNERAWKDIYMHRQGHKQMQKAGIPARQNRAHAIIIAPDDVHARQRRLLSHAFSERALRDQEPLIQEYVSLLISNMRDDAKEGRETDMVQNFNLTTFDIISDLSFGESFGGLRMRTPHPWVQAFFDMATIGTIMTQLVLLKIPIISILVGLLVLPILRKRLGIMAYTKDKIEKRIDQGTERPDFMSYVLRHNDENGMSREEIQATFNVLMIAGSETTATSLAGCIYLLQKHPEVRQKLHAEIRNTFRDDKEITMLSVGHLMYLDAVVEESLRLYPPVPIALNRTTPPEGAAICGHWVPGNVAVGIPQFAAYTSPLNFVEPDSFAPERMLRDHDVKFDKDHKAVLQPFSTGPRNCIGRNLAIAEIKLILARIIFNFDLELVDERSNWLDQEVSSLWKKHPLMVRVKDVRV